MDARTLLYLNRVSEAIDKPDHTIMTTDDCTECDRHIGDALFNSAEHWYLFDRKRGEHVVVIGCQGYYQINPVSVGVHDVPHWMGIEGVNV